MFILLKAIFNSYRNNSNVPLLKWFFAIYLFTSLKKGISSVQLSKYIGVTQTITWFMLQRIRVAMEDEIIQFEGISEIDEVYIGKILSFF